MQFILHRLNMIKMEMQQIYSNRKGSQENNLLAAYFITRKRGMKMNEYLEQAKNFLNKANAKCEIVYGGISRNETWKETAKRNWYDVTITTPRGKMSYVFWDSINDTEISHMTLEEYVEKKLKCRYSDLPYNEQKKVERELKRLKAEAVPSEYDVLACLEKYDVGTFEDFCSEFGYDEDSRTAEQIYIAVIKEYKDLTRIFTEEQMEELSEIQQEV